MARERPPSENYAGDAERGASPLVLREFLGMLRAHAVWGLVAGALASFLVMRSAVRKPEVYRSTAVVQLNMSGTTAGSDSLAQVIYAGEETDNEAERMTIMSSDLARQSVLAPGSYLLAYLEQVRDATWARWWTRFRGRGRAEAHIRVRLHAGHPPKPTRRRVRFERRQDKAWALMDATSTDAREIGLFEFAEPWSDANGDGRWTPAEPYTDQNGNGRYDPSEPFDDANGDGRCNPSEPFDDLDGDGKRDAAEPFIDLDSNGRWDPGEPFEDGDGDARCDRQESFDDLDGDGFWRRFGEPWTDLDGDGTWFPGEPFHDVNGNGVRDDADPFDDLDGDGTWSSGKPLEIDGNRLDLLLVAGDPEKHVFDLVVMSTEEAVGRVVGSVSASASNPYSNIAHVGVSSGDPFQARDIAQAVIDAYIARRRAARTEKHDALLSWIQSQMGVATKRLGDAYRRRDDYIRREGAVLLQERASAAFEEAEALTRERLQVEFDLGQLDDEAAVLDESRSPLDVLRSLPAEAVDAHTRSLLDARTTHQTELARLERHGHGRGSPEHDDTRVRLEQAETLLLDAVKKLILDRRAALDQTRDRLRRRLQVAVSREAAKKSLLKDLPRLEQGLAELTRPVEEARRVIEEFLRWQSEARIARASTTTPVAMLESASLNPQPVAPNRLLDLVLAVVAGLGAAMAACWLREHLDTRVRNARQVEVGLHRPLAGAIPDHATVKRRERAAKSQPLVALHNESGLLAESYRKLRGSIRHEHRDAPLRTLAITSSTQGEGKSVTTLNLAITMAKAGERVLVIDADLRRPSIHLLAGIDRRPGLVDWAVEGKPWRLSVVPGPCPGLDILPVGGSGEVVTNVLGPDDMPRLLAEARETYDAILVDVPPVLAVSDALSFFHALDGVMLLVRAGRYGIDVPREAAAMIERAGGRLQGVILNAFDARLAARRGGAYYGYRYGSRYAYR